MRSFAVLLLALAALPAEAKIPAEEDSCLGCHGTDASMSMDLPSGEKLGLFVDQDAFAKSVHGEMLRCTECHADKSDYPHESKPFKSRRDVTVAYYEQCKKCHFSNYTKTLDGVHFQLAQKGNRQTAVCVDCHGSHAIGRPAEPRSRVSATCAGCHKGVHDTYATSVHGKAMLEGNGDVPVCTDCHHAHDVTDPRAGALSLRTAEICGRCHTDEKLMKKYGLSTKVVDTYLTDFHGMAATLQKGKKGRGERLAAGCTDCHGVHDIQKPEDPRSSVLRANLVQTCRKCHPEATDSFPAAWMSHYEPSLKKTPLVWSVRLFYYILIPFILISLAVQIALHLWRVVVNR